MTETPTGEATAEAPTAPAAVETPAAVEAPSEPIDWDALNSTLERAYTADPKVAAEHLKKHRAIGGIAGSIAERRLQELDGQRQAERQAEAATKAREDLKKMAQDQPLQFADMFLNNEQANEARERISNVETNAQKKILEQVGAAFHEFEEWGGITDVERERLATALQGVSNDQLISKFNKVALDIVADRRADKRLTDRLPKEKEAWRKEWEAERLASESGPDLRRPSSTTRRSLNWASMDDKDFAKYWKEKFPNST